KNAELKLTQLGLKYRIANQPSTSVTTNFGISQDPSSGVPVPKGTVVTLNVSSGKPKTNVPPHLIGETLQQALSDLSNAGLHQRIRYVHSDKPSGSITATAPKSGTRRFVGSPDTLNVSSGPRQVLVPNVAGDQYLSAVSALKGQDFVPTRRDVSDSAAIGQV